MKYPLHVIRRSCLAGAVLLALGPVGAPALAALVTGPSGPTGSPASVSNFHQLASGAQWTNQRQQDWNRSSADDSCKNESFSQVSGTGCVADVSAECNYGHYDFNFNDTTIRIACDGISNLHNCDGNLHHTWCPAN